MIPVILVRDLYDKMERGERPYVVDVRSPEEFSGGTVPGAINIPLPDLPLSVGDIPSDKPVYLICRSGGRSAQAALYLAASGRPNAVNVGRGMLAWLEEGLPIE